MQFRAGVQISRKAFFQSFFILLALMIIAGILTLVLPSGRYIRVEQNGRQLIDPTLFQFVKKPDYPFWRWFTASFEVLAGDDAIIIDTIIIFILMVGASFAVLDKSGILGAAIMQLIKTFGGRKYLLLLIMSLFFMLRGAFFGLFEEIVPLVPMMIALAYYLGWDALVGMGMSILATNLGFSAAMTNPFTIGVAQRLADLPLFSGILFRIPIFITIYVLLAVFLFRYAHSIDRHPEASLVFDEHKMERERYKTLSLDSILREDIKLGKATLFFLVFLALIVLALLLGPLIPGLSDISLPLVGLLFLMGGLGAGLISGAGQRTVWRAAWEGISGIAPGIPLIMMAASIKHIVTSGSVMDTILNSASQWLSDANEVSGVLIIYALALLIEFFIGSAGAKAVLMMPVLLPLTDLIGITRQITVTAYCFGDGFSNLAYPTNPVLLIALGLANVSYSRWMRWTLKLWLAILPVTLFFLWLGVKIHLGPF
jgi:uncharacterized ion transporter superfamily protein YfcC